MRRTSACILLAFFLIMVAPLARAQSIKPGLWDVTTTTTWQQSPFPAGVAPAGINGPHTMQMCFTQEQIDRFGTIVPESHSNSCQVTNVVKTISSMTAEMVCTGRMSGKSTMETNWSDGEHATGKAHFIGAMQSSQGSKPIEWSATSSSVFRGADCGSVKPMLPPNK
jgi:hypothetical protein